MKLTKYFLIQYYQIIGFVNYNKICDINPISRVHNRGTRIGIPQTWIINIILLNINYQKLLSIINIINILLYAGNSGKYHFNNDFFFFAGI